MSIKLNNNNLKGTIPDEIANFKNLITLNLSQNEFNLQGTEFPIKITELSKLQNLYLNNCNLISNTTIINGFEEKFITKKIGNLSALKILDLSNNKLNGPLIFEWGNLKSLEELNISNNDLSGILSSELGNLRKIKKISAGGNLFTGSIPYEIGNIQSLEEFSFQENSLSGALPDFTKSNIKVFFVGGNQALSGNLSVSGLCKPNLTINIDGTNITDDCP
ncbi:MAG: hypothetical protein ACEQSF_06335 [Solirubrobacteraceae bacterium]